MSLGVLFFGPGMCMAIVDWAARQLSDGREVDIIKERVVQYRGCDQYPSPTSITYGVSFFR